MARGSKTRLQQQLQGSQQHPPSCFLPPESLYLNLNPGWLKSLASDEAIRVMGETKERFGRFRAGISHLLLAGCMLVLFSWPAAGAIKRYTDEKGTIHITTDERGEGGGAPPPVNPYMMRQPFRGPRAFPRSRVEHPPPPAIEPPASEPPPVPLPPVPPPQVGPVPVEPVPENLAPEEPPPE